MPFKKAKPCKSFFFFSADEIIRMTISKLYKEFGLSLKPINETINKFVLKVAGFREYMMGSTPLSQYDRVRESLRGLKTLKLGLAEIS